MSVSRDGGISLKDPGELHPDDIHQIQFTKDAESGGVLSPGDSRNHVWHAPVETEDNEVFVVLDVVFDTENQVGDIAAVGLNTDAQLNVGGNIIASTERQGEVTDENKHETAIVAATYEKLLQVDTTAALAFARGTDLEWQVRPRPEAPGIMPFSQGGVVVSNFSNSQDDIQVPSGTMRGYVLEVDDDQMTRYLRSLRA